MFLRVYDSIVISRRGRITIIVLDRPDVRNSTNATLHEELANIFYDQDSDPETDIVVLTRNGSVSCAGEDVKCMRISSRNKRSMIGLHGRKTHRRHHPRLP
ncbi:enoyl-CoA hydratase-related protein [Advenella incenata]|uniref:enoyl-CoA hydratase-related protein n=1 Tax=Advenella incenata TaxID=267800 RepID=UPI00102903FE